MRQPIMLSNLFGTFCSFGRQNLFHKKASPFQVFVIPALEQERYGEFLPWGPGLGAFTLERFSYTEEESRNIRLIQDFIVPALDEETYGDLLAWDSEPGVFKIKWMHKARSSWTEEDSRVFIRSTKEESEGHLEQKIIPVPTKETGAIPKIKVVAAVNPRLERSPKKETDAKPKLPRSLACILDSQNINYDRSIGPRRTTKVSQEVWASSLGIKQEEPTYFPAEKEMGLPSGSVSAGFALPWTHFQQMQFLDEVEPVELSTSNLDVSWESSQLSLQDASDSEMTVDNPIPCNSQSVDEPSELLANVPPCPVVSRKRSSPDNDLLMKACETLNNVATAQMSAEDALGQYIAQKLKCIQDPIKKKCC